MIKLKKGEKAVKIDDRTWIIVDESIDNEVAKTKFLQKINRSNTKLLSTK